MIKTFRVFARAINTRGFTIGITQFVNAVNVKQAIDVVNRESLNAGLTDVRIYSVQQVRNIT
ncbi:TPA: hypothetical protein ACHGD4_000004 [Escherichia coli]|nr:hypothetical protein [Escherichia coli O146]